MIQQAMHIGKPLNRIDGRMKVTGTAPYPIDIVLEDAVPAVIVNSTIAKGAIKQIDTRRTEQLPGVLGVLTHQNAPSIQHLPFQLWQVNGLLPLQENIIAYGDQPIAVVIAETIEQARYAATLLEIEYEPQVPLLEMKDALDQAFSPQDIPDWGIFFNTERGDTQKALDASQVMLDQFYTTPMETHNPIALFATVARWDDDSHLTVYDSTQAVVGVREALAATFAIPSEQVHVISTFVGGAFGCAYRLWPYTILTCMAARYLKRAVKIVLTRRQMFTSVGHRPATMQRIALGATNDGHFSAILHEVNSQSSVVDDYSETVTTGARMLYACPNVKTSYKLVRLNLGTPSFMRGPGESTGSFALESAIDELSYMLGMDPIEMRRRNYTDVHPEMQLPWSSNALQECYRLGAQKIGWERRTPAPRSMRDGNMLVGLGMATASYPYGQFPAQAQAFLYADGSALVQSATSDIGPGTATVMTQIAADALGLPSSSVRFELGDSRLPFSPPQVGSMTVSSVGPAVLDAAQKAREQALALAIADPQSPLYGVSAADVLFERGGLFLKGNPAQGETYATLLQRSGTEQIQGMGATQPSYGAPFASHGFGAQFAEVQVDPDLGIVRVSRFVGAFGVGRVLNPKLARSQMLGGVVWGIGMALQEETLLDQQLGRVINASLAGYHIPVHADIVEPEILFIEEDDAHINPLRAKGLAEICIVGVAAAIANAVYHATGKRIRSLPITLDKLLDA
jgi:xanthine dehydrogenase YagR molybdenum-binding subunit